MQTSDFDYDLPPELIAQRPPPSRDDARMLVLDRGRDTVAHRRVRDLPGHLRAGDVLVLNNTRVIPARLLGRKIPSGGKVDVLLVEETSAGVWQALWRGSGHARPGQRWALGSDRIEAEVLGAGPGGSVTLRLQASGTMLEMLETVGLPPLPPYIRRSDGRSGVAPSDAGLPPGDVAPRDPGLPAIGPEDRDRYQTVYARVPGAVAAPTAGLHFTPGLLAEVRGRGVRVAEVTLHVGPGTFRPVTAERIEDHVMEPERYEITSEAAAAVNGVRPSGGRIVAVGSTSVRVLETAASEDGRVAAGAGRTGLFIAPPRRFRAVDALLTNFHLPRSTLLMMVCAFAGRERVMDVYQEAVRERYRFYSYGDCMLIL
jgi:S-adenosylmethionine:tRNA ribosyltransferase-isomerase